MAAYDQALVRRVGNVWRRLGGVPLCEVCARQPVCDLRKAIETMGASRKAKIMVQECGAYIPVISFQDPTGLEGRFNTFRRGGGWGKRVQPGDRVALFDMTGKCLIGFARVTASHIGVLRDLLRDHAHNNHLMKTKPAEQSAILLSIVLLRLYGRSYGNQDQEFSVVEMELEDLNEHRERDAA